MRCVPAIAIFALIVAPASTARRADAQGTLRTQCATAATEATRQFCELAAYAASELIARTAIVSVAGNPVPGTASTFGLRLGPIPRMSLAGRGMVSWISLPPIERRTSTDNPDGLITSLNADASVGLFTGKSLGPTVGGFLGVDLLGSVGMTWLPGGDGIDNDRPIQWAAGARVGITRESFTAPGISISGMYRNFGEVSYGRGDLANADAFLHADNHHAWSLRGAIGKRISVLSGTAGVGYDIHSADVLLRVGQNGTIEQEAVESDVTVKRWSAFVNGSFTMLILSLVGELGWQQGGDAPETLPGASDVGKNTFFAGFAVRLAI